VSHAKYELGFYDPEDGILYSHRRENLKSYIKQLLLHESKSSLRPGSSYMGSWAGRAALAQVFSEYIGFPCHSFINSFIHSSIPQIDPQPSPSIIQGWHSRPVNVGGNSGLDSTPAP
jgi:hypothetical protein